MGNISYFFYGSGKANPSFGWLKSFCLLISDILGLIERIAEEDLEPEGRNLLSRDEFFLSKETIFGLEKTHSTVKQMTPMLANKGPKFLVFSHSMFKTKNRVLLIIPFRDFCRTSLSEELRRTQPGRIDSKNSLNTVNRWFLVCS